MINGSKVISHEKYYDLLDIGKFLNCKKIKGRKIFKILKDENIFDKNNFPMEQYSKEYFIIEKNYIKVTTKGVILINHLIKKNNYNCNIKGDALEIHKIFYELIYDKEYKETININFYDRIESIYNSVEKSNKISKIYFITGLIMTTLGIALSLLTLIY